MKKKKVICIGEALIDRIRNKSNQEFTDFLGGAPANVCLLYTSPSPRDRQKSRMPSSA